MRIERLGPEDAERAAEAIRALHEEAASIDHLRRWLGGEERHLLVAYEGERAVGLAYGFELPRVKRDASAMLMYEIDVAEDRRGRGIGRALMEEFRRVCGERGTDSMWLLTDDSNKPAMALYRGAGGVDRDDREVMFEFGPPWRV